MSAAAASARSAVVAEVVRSGVVESIHVGRVVLLDPAGRRMLEFGDVDTPIFPRSSLKPLQATAVLGCGPRLGGSDPAILASSHSGEPVHVEAVRVVLAASGLSEDDLGCPPALPLHQDAMLAHVRAGRGPERICMNCSGKHAGMLAACVAQGWPVTAYLDPDHPLQRRIAATVAEFTGAQPGSPGVDGCGAPLFPVSLAGLARSFAALVRAPDGSPARRIADSMRTHPHLVGGTGRDVTAFMRAVPGVLAKDGAEGVYAAALDDGTAVALKVSDGAPRAACTVLAAVLAAVLIGRGEPLLADAVRAAGRVSVLGGGVVVGEVQPSSTLLAAAMGAS